MHHIEQDPEDTYTDDDLEVDGKIFKLYKSNIDRIVRDGYIFEIVLLRRSSDFIRLNKSFYKNMSFNKDDNQQSKTKDDNIIFDLKVIRVFNDIKKHFGENTPDITSGGTLASVIYDENEVAQKLVYETLDLEHFLEGKFGVNEKTYVDNKVSDYTWIIIPPGFIGYKNDRAVFIKLDIEIDKKEDKIYNPMNGSEGVSEIMVVSLNPVKVIPIDFILGK